LFDRSLVATISRFDMSLKNAILTISRLEDPAGIGYRTQAGVQTTDGWDADLAWQPTRRWALVGGIGELTSRNETGRRNRNVAEGLNWRILAKYTQPEGPLKGLSVGAGYVFVNERAGDATDTFTLPDYFTWDAFAAYRRGRWGVQVNVYNLTDELYAQTSVNARRIFAGEPRKVRLTTTLRF
jgi:iron complex outermembrane receptor protein